MKETGPAQGNGCPKFTAVRTAGFAEILQRLPGERKAIASDLGLPYTTYVHYVLGEQSFPPDLIPRLFAVTGERRVLEFFLEPLGLQAVSKATPNQIPGTDSPDVYRLLMDAMERLGSATHEVRQAKIDDKISPSEYARITYFLREIERLAAEVREQIKAEVK